MNVKALLCMDAFIKWTYFPFHAHQHGKNQKSDDTKYSQGLKK